MDILESIKSQYDTFGKVQKRIADYLLAHPDEACFLSLKDFTKQVDVTEVTVLNFTKKIGLKSYLELKKELQEYIQRWLAPNDKLKRAITGITDETCAYTEIIQNEKSTLEETYRFISIEDLKTAVRLMLGARRIYIGAHGVSRAVAAFLEQRLFFLGVDVYMVNVYDRRGTATILNKVSREDLFFLITMPNYSSEVLSIASFLYSRELPFIALTDRLSSPLCAGASVSFACSTNDSIFYNTVTAPVSVVNLIASAYAVDSGCGFVENRERVIEIEKELIQTNRF